MKKTRESSKRKKYLERIFYKNIPKARSINPFFREYFELMYDAHTSISASDKVLNIFSSSDLSYNSAYSYSSSSESESLLSWSIIL